MQRPAIPFSSPPKDIEWLWKGISHVELSQLPFSSLQYRMEPLVFYISVAQKREWYGWTGPYVLMEVICQIDCGFSLLWMSPPLCATHSSSALKINISKCILRSDSRVWLLEFLCVVRHKSQARSLPTVKCRLNTKTAQGVNREWYCFSWRSMSVRDFIKGRVINSDLVSAHSLKHIAHKNVKSWFQVLTSTFEEKLVDGFAKVFQVCGVRSLF